jgi:hypothetical protein
MLEKKQNKRCFVIMPFSKTTAEHTEAYWSTHYKDFLKPLIENYPEIEAFKSEALRVDIVKQIIADLLTCEVVVADLTDHNPNVFWELGVRQSFKSGTITIAEDGTPLPFDIDKKGTLFYFPHDHIKNAQFINDFSRAIKDCIDNPKKCDSLILEAFKRGTLFEIFQHDETLRRLEAVLSECDTNSKLFSTQVEQCKTNVEIRSSEQKKAVTLDQRLLRSLALELLITERYVDEPLTFYKGVENIHDWIIVINEHLHKWSSSSKWAEGFLIKAENSWNLELAKFKESITAVYNKISQNI